MNVSRHAYERGKQRCGVNLYRLATLMKARGLSLPHNGSVEAPGFGTLILKDGNIVTVLDEGMAVVRSAS